MKSLRDEINDLFWRNADRYWIAVPPPHDFPGGNWRFFHFPSFSSRKKDMFEELLKG